MKRHDRSYIVFILENGVSAQAQVGPLPFEWQNYEYATFASGQSATIYKDGEGKTWKYVDPI